MITLKVSWFKSIDAPPGGSRDDPSMAAIDIGQATVVSFIVIVVVLSVIQIPLDLREHLLSRRATVTSALAVLATIVTDIGLFGMSARASESLVATIGVVFCYWFLHHIAFGLVGWGDVLLVAPLTGAIAYVSVESVLWWQLLAASTAVVHAVIARTNNGSRHVPFGPHLLLGSILFLTIQV